MKKLLLATAAIAMFGSAANADVLRLNGSVDYQCDAAFDGRGTASVNLYETGDQDLGAINVNCNDADGFTLELASANGFVLTDGTYTVPYRIGFDGPGASSVPLTNSNPISVNETSWSEISTEDQYRIEMIFNIDFSGNAIPGGTVVTDELNLTIDGN